MEDLTDHAICVLRQLVDCPTWAGNIVSKSGLQELRTLGYVRYDKNAIDPDLVKRLPPPAHAYGAYVIDWEAIRRAISEPDTRRVRRRKKETDTSYATVV
jgi:hypothetical protein